MYLNYPRFDLPMPVMTPEEYDRVIASHARPYVVSVTPHDGAGALRVFGIVHTFDPADAQLDKLRREWNEFRPTVALLEGRMGLFIGGEDAGIRQFGESAVVYTLAHRAGVRLYTLEVPMEKEIEEALRGATPEQASMYFILRPYFGKRNHGPVESPESVVAEYVRKRGRLAGLNGAIREVADIDRIWKRDYPGSDWRDEMDKDGLPGYIGEVARQVNIARDEHWARALIHLVRSGERVFASCGASHAVKLEPALRGGL